MVWRTRPSDADVTLRAMSKVGRERKLFRHLNELGFAMRVAVSTCLANIVLLVTRLFGCLPLSSSVEMRREHRDLSCDFVGVGHVKSL